MLSQKFLILCLVLFILFSLFFSCGSDFYHSVFHVTYSFSASIILHLIHSSVFFISDIVLLCLLILLVFSSSLTITCNLSICVSIYFPRSWIIFSIITLNSFFRYVNYLLFSSCFFVWKLFLCHLIVLNFLYLLSPWWKVCRCSSWCLL